MEAASVDHSYGKSGKEQRGRFYKIQTAWTREKLLQERKRMKAWETEGSCTT